MADQTAPLRNFSHYPGGLAAPGETARQLRLAMLLAPAVAELRRAGGDADKAGRVAAALAALRAEAAAKGDSLELLIFYLQLWAMDIEVAEQYSAARARFDVADPPADFWYQRIDAVGSQDFFQGGIYLTSTIPKVQNDKYDTYYNAEIYNSTLTRRQPRNVIANLFPVDDPFANEQELANFLYDLFLNVPFVAGNGLEMSACVRAETVKGGSRGWGFWSTSGLPPTMHVAWFIQFDGVQTGTVKPFYDKGLYAITQNGISGMSVTQLPDLDEDWHDYRIRIAGGIVDFFIDGACVASVTDPDQIPSGPMAFHNWVDNALFGLDTQNDIITHILQNTEAARSNIMKSLRIRSLP